ncbi:unnamed protein product [Schistosoma curassoni]|uniref:Uncharacterized protein n=1 Tax=Schistosoma curassoni TaxID=6186 RepID=A0A183JVC0_9TREM|nr:unnamed protein product [Schistosoma curassoni]
MTSIWSPLLNQYQNLTCHCQPCTDCTNDELYSMKVMNCYCKIIDIIIFVLIGF